MVHATAEAEAEPFPIRAAGTANGYYCGKDDVFYCNECAKTHGLE